eukprot:2413300-Amphidinium_carterae.1
MIRMAGLENALKKTLKKLGHAKGSKGSSGSSMFCSSSGSAVRPMRYKNSNPQLRPFQHSL